MCDTGRRPLLEIGAQIRVTFRELSIARPIVISGGEANQAGSSQPLPTVRCGSGVVLSIMIPALVRYRGCSCCGSIT